MVPISLKNTITLKLEKINEVKVNTTSNKIGYSTLEIRRATAYLKNYFGSIFVCFFIVFAGILFTVFECRTVAKEGRKSIQSMLKCQLSR